MTETDRSPIMDPFRTFTALSITPTADDLAHSALPNAPVKPFKTTTPALRRLINRTAAIVRRRDPDCDLEVCRPAFSSSGSTS